MYREASERDLSTGRASLRPTTRLHTVNLVRDPGWRRNDESFSGDPLLTAQIASPFVDRREGEDEQENLLSQGGVYPKTIATAEHYAATKTPGGLTGGP